MCVCVCVCVCVRACVCACVRACGVGAVTEAGGDPAAVFQAPSKNDRATFIARSPGLDCVFVWFALACFLSPKHNASLCRSPTSYPCLAAAVAAAVTLLHLSCCCMQNDVHLVSSLNDEVSRSGSERARAPKALEVTANQHTHTHARVRPFVLTPCHSAPWPVHRRTSSC